MVEIKPISLSLNQLSAGLSVRTAISPTLTEEFIIHPSVYAEIKKLGHAKSDVLLNESESSLGVVSFSNMIENSSYDLSHVKNFNTRNDLSSLIKDYKFLVCSVFFVYFRFSSGLDEKEKKEISTAADSVQSGWPVVASRKANCQQTTQSSRAGAAR
ncbi:hypothetical protein TNCV_1833211 [Trichonephila clavipes]|nr:hypothetical protein TNCV_1833211 [Trichonephila clavipes]